MSNTGFSLTSTLQRGDFFDIQGVSGSGKTSVAMFMAMTTVLPSDYLLRSEGESKVENENGRDKRERMISIGGKGKEVVWIQSTSHASIVSKVSRWMEVHIEHCLNEDLGVASKHKNEIQEIIQTSLKRLTIFTLPHVSPDVGSPYDPLAIVLLNLPQHVQKNLKSELSLLVIDGMGDNFWAGRFHREERQSQNTRASSVGVRDGAEMRDVLTALTDIRRDMGTVVVVTTQALWTNMSANPKSTFNEGTQTQTQTNRDTRFWAQHLPSPFPNPFNTKINVSASARNRAIPHNPRTAHLQGSGAGADAGAQIPPSSFAPPPISPPRLRLSQPSTDLYWPLTAHITLLPLQSSVPILRPDLTLDDLLRQGGQADQRESARVMAKRKGLVRMVDPSTGLAEERQQVGEFEYRIGKDGLEFW